MQARLIGGGPDRRQQTRRGRRLAALAAAAAGMTAWALAGTAVAAPTGPRSAAAEDSRFEIFATNDYRIFNTVGLVRDIDESDPEHGSGFLISPCHVLTNYHVVFGSDSAQPVTNKRVRFSLGIAGNGGTETVAGTVVGYGEDFQPTRNRYSDWALIRLDSSPGEKYGYFNIASTPFPAVRQLELVSAGYPADKPVSALWGDSCRIPDRESYGWMTNCILVPGSSGGPVATRNARGEYVVVGMNAGFHVNRGLISKTESSRERMNIVTPISGLYERVQGLMKANACKAAPGMTASAASAG